MPIYTDVRINVMVADKTMTITGFDNQELLDLRRDWELRRFFHTETVNPDKSVTYKFTNSYGVIQGYKMALDYIGDVAH